MLDHLLSPKGLWAQPQPLQVNNGPAADEDGLDPAVASSLQVQAAALRRTVSALQMQASATEQGLLKRLSHTEHAEQAQVALKEEVEQTSRQVGYCFIASMMPEAMSLRAYTV